jgi:hypothetical protein
VLLLIRRPPVRERLQRLDRGAALPEAPHLAEDVDHGLRGEAGDARAADVVEAAGEPRREHRLEQLALGFEQLRPGGVVLDDPN